MIKYLVLAVFLVGCSGSSVDRYQKELRSAGCKAKFISSGTMIYDCSDVEGYPDSIHIIGEYR